MMDFLSRNSSDQIEYQLLEKAFDSKFILNDFYNQLSQYLVKCIDDWVPSNPGQSAIFAPICVLCQSSGHGKTRCMKEFARTHATVYICLGRNNQNIYPPVSSISYHLIQCLSNPKASANFLYHLVDKTLDLISKIKSDLKNISFIDEFNIYQNDGSNSISFCNSIRESQEINIDISDMNEYILKKFNGCMGTESLFIFIDEANHLLDKSDCIESSKYLSKYQLLRRTVQSLFKNVRLAFLGNYNEFLIFYKLKNI